jgi:hypothetical protein
VAIRRIFAVSGIGCCVAHFQSNVVNMASCFSFNALDHPRLGNAISAFIRDEIDGSIAESVGRLPADLNHHFAQFVDAKVFHIKTT